jgi:hypothetical protein
MGVVVDWGVRLKNECVMWSVRLRMGVSCGRGLEG